MSLDLLIRNGTLVDGSGGPRYRAAGYRLTLQYNDIDSHVTSAGTGQWLMCDPIVAFR